MVQAMPRWTDYRAPDTLPDDTEESVLGTQWHQEASSALAEMLTEVAIVRGETWGVCTQVALMGLRHADGRPYDPRPDLMVLPRPLPSGGMSSIALIDIGAPLFIVEVVSRSTVANDVADKRAAYEAIGVGEYILYDPDGALLSTPLLGWRLQTGVLMPWRPEPDGSWHSTVLDLYLLPAQPLLGVRDRDGRQIESPQRARARARAAEQAEQRVRELEDELRRLRGERAPLQ